MKVTVETHALTVAPTLLSSPDLALPPPLTVGHEVLSDGEQIARGTFHPIDGFMTTETLRSVLATYRLPDGAVWPLPVVLVLPGAQVRHLAAGDQVTLVDDGGVPHALLNVTEVAALDVEALCRNWFGTDDDRHPGVHALRRRGEHLVAGPVTLLRRPEPGTYEELDPARAREKFAARGWSRVVAFHGRNVPHRVHEHLQLLALERCGADGLLISPVIGLRKPGDFLPRPIIKAYRLLLRLGVYPAGRAMLGSFSSYPRYAGPREAVFTALCRRNLGCSHIIIGRDHTGVGDFYAADAVTRLFDALPDLGIEPVLFPAYGWDAASGHYLPLDQAHQPRQISGTAVREALLAGRRLPDWLIRAEVQELLLALAAAGEPLFQGG